MLYWPDDVPGKLDENAGHYVNLIKDILKAYKGDFGKPGIIVAPYDCELFGHWWFEGNWWLARVLRWIEDEPEIELTNTRLHMEQNPPNKVVQIIEGSWGQGSSHWVWLNKWTTWTWRVIYDAEDKTEKIMAKYGRTKDENLKKILKQLARELLLLQSSDWQFLITTWSARDYSEGRISLHYENFNRLYLMAMRYGNGEFIEEGEWHFLGKIEENDGIFKDIDLTPFIPE
jgi:1,4-alpha-glucan branching enzyme